MGRDNIQADQFNVSYGLAGAAVTTGAVAVATTEAAYYGISIVAGSLKPAIITIYDNSSAASGNIIERINVQAQDSRLNERYNPVMAKNGIYLVATGTDLTGTIFYGPKG